VSPLAPWGERTGDDEAQAAVFTAVVTVFVLLVVYMSSVIAIVHPEPFSARFRRNTLKTGWRQAISSEPPGNV
jgi:hypothetical protein